MNAIRLISSLLLMVPACMQVVQADTTAQTNDQLNVVPVQEIAPRSGSQLALSVSVHNKTAAPINVFQGGTKNLVQPKDSWTSDYSKGVVTLTPTGKDSKILFVISEGQSAKCKSELCLTVQ
ncbi:hypothetical protein [Pseudomonas gozinkensis]|uniref:hypothetical protein n=1 Tax=Pseudomonas gozinkensis TaxID=2774461 RepID=UPI001788516C|nr:hypothetical protein [Pseudomonas gozinkensis]